VRDCVNCDLNGGLCQRHRAELIKRFIEKLELSAPIEPVHYPDCGDNSLCQCQELGGEG